MKASISLTLLSCTLLLVRCQLTPETEVALVLPELPRRWEFADKQPEYVIEYIDLSGKLISEKRKGGVEDVIMRLPKWNNVPLLVFPVIDGVRMKPAGALFPKDTQGSRADGGNTPVVLSWEDGFIASLFKELWINSTIASGINSDRLCREIREKAEEHAGGNPWALDMPAMAEGFRFGSFSTHLIDAAPHYKLDLAGVTGTWVSSDPFFSPVTASQAGGLSLSDLYLGLHRFFHQESGKRIDLYVTEKGWYCINVSREQIASGTW